MRNVVASVLLLTCFWVVSVSSVDKQDLKLPSYVDVCYRDDPQVAKCIRRAIEKLVPVFKGGSKDFELEPLDPLDFLNFTFTYKSPLLGGTMTIPKVVLHGLSKLRVLSVRPQLTTQNKFVLDFDVIIPLLSSKTDYHLIGNVLTSDVDMKGHSDIDLENVTLSYHLEGIVKPINKVDYLELQSFNWRFSGDNIQRLHVLNEDVVEGRPLLSRAVVALLKNAWRPLLNQIIPAILPRTDASLKEMFSKFFKKYPYNVLFPKRKT